MGDRNGSSEKSTPPLKEVFRPAAVMFGVGAVTGFVLDGNPLSTLSMGSAAAAGVVFGHFYINARQGSLSGSGNNPKP